MEEEFDTVSLNQTLDQKQGPAVAWITYTWQSTCHISHMQNYLLSSEIGGLDRVANVARAALAERSGSSTKGRTPNIRYFVAKPSIVSIYAFF